MNLPAACKKCAPFDGYWAMKEGGALPGKMGRCDCPRGMALAGRDKTRAPMEPLISPKFAMICAEMMATISFFPAEAGARGVIADEIASMCASEAEAKWLVKRMIRLYERWPGVPEMRRVYCSKHKPLDGIADRGFSEVYPEGIPSERPEEPPKLLAGVSSAQLPRISAAPSLEATVLDLAKAKNLNLVRKPPVQVRDVPVVQITDANRITEADIRRAEDEYRAAQAKKELP